MTFMKIRRNLKKRNLESGQALVLLAAAFVGVAAFIGLTIDAGILFTNVGHLRRATDASSLAAANQFREGRTPLELSNMAFEYLELNGISPSGVVAKICDLDNPGSIYDDTSLCSSPGEPARKYVRVETTLEVHFAFLPIVGWQSTVIGADSVSEAASLDLVLALDVSPSMAYDLCNDGIDNDEDGTIDDCASNDPADNTGPPNLGGIHNSESDVAQCTANAALPDDGPGENPAAAPDGDREDDCHPFEEVRDAAKRLVDRMYFPYDRISIVTFAREAAVQLELQDTDSPAPCGVFPVPDPYTCVNTVIDNLDVELEPVPATHCPGWAPDPSGCTSTNIGDGLRYAGGRFCLDDIIVNGDCDRVEMREEAVWITILLSDGAANAAVVNAPPLVPGDWLCPNTTWAASPYCRDDSASTRHASSSPVYDADDYAHDMADFVGCPNDTLPQPAGCASAAPGGQGAVIFSIGLGDAVINNSAGDADAGEQLLRYLAAVGDDADPDTDPCSSTSTGTNCGNYYFSPSGTGLIQVFEAIASRIFTRITH